MKRAATPGAKEARPGRRHQGGWYRGAAGTTGPASSLRPETAGSGQPGPAKIAVGGPMYRQVSPQVDLPALEHEVLGFWREERIFERSIEQSAGRPLWVFYEGPPTANGMPGTHHVEAHVFMYALPRYFTMNCYHVPSKSVWDC